MKIRHPNLLFALPLAISLLLFNTSTALSASLATLKVIVNVVNTNGGTNVAGDFLVHLNGANAAPNIFNGSSSGTSVALDASSTYSVSITTLSYVPSYSPACTGSLAALGNATCTVTLTDTGSVVSQNPQNLILNPSLETASSSLPTSWFQGGFGTNNRSFVYPVPGVGGGVAAEVVITSLTDGDAKWFFAEVPVLAGHSYAFSDQYISAVPTELAAEFFDVNNVQLPTQEFVTVPASSPGTFTPAKGTFVVPSGAAFMTVFHLLKTVGTLTVDDYSLTAVPLPNPFAAGFVSLTFDDGDVSQLNSALPILQSSNIKADFYITSHLIGGLTVFNPSLETPNGSSPAGWTFSSASPSTTFIYPVPGHTGVGAEVDSTGPNSNAGWKFDSVSILADKVYSFTGWYQSTANSELAALYTTVSGTVIQADITDATGTSLGTSVALPSTNNVWTPVQAFFYVPPTAASVTVVNRLLGVGKLVVDDVDISTPGFMTLDNLKSLLAAGQELGSHTQTHPDLTSLSLNQASQEISGGLNDLTRTGLGPVSSFAYPFGSFNDSVQQLLVNNNFTSARTVIPGFNGTDAPKLALLSQSVNSDTTLAQVEAWVDQAKNDRTWLILTLHDVKADLTGIPFGTTPTVLQGIVNYLSSNNIPTHTMTDGLKLMTATTVLPPTPPPPTPTTTPTTTPITTTSTLQISTRVINSFGGTATSSDFLISITGTNPLPSSFSGSITTSTVIVSPGPYSIFVSSTLPLNYTASTSPGCVGTIAAGQIQSCLIQISDKDIVPPVITLNGSSTINITVGDTFIDPGAVAADNIDGDLTSKIVVSGDVVNTSTAGTYHRLYDVTDAAGNHATQLSRAIVVASSVVIIPGPIIIGGGGGESIGSGGGGGWAAIVKASLPTSLNHIDHFSLLATPTTTNTSPPVPKVLGQKISRLEQLARKLKFGMRNKEVRELQVGLQNNGSFKNHVITNYYGSVTATAVKRYLASLQPKNKTVLKR